MTGRSLIHGETRMGFPTCHAARKASLLTVFFAGRPTIGYPTIRTTSTVKGDPSAPWFRSLRVQRGPFARLPAYIHRNRVAKSSPPCAKRRPPLKL